MESRKDFIILKAECHCGAFTARYRIPKTCLPLKAAACSCDSCRHLSGQLFATYAVIPDAAVQLSDANLEWVDPLPLAEPWMERKIGSGAVKQFKWSENIVTNFCAVCGARIANLERGEFEFATGILSVLDGANDDKQLEGLLNRQCLFVDDAKDGGAVIWFPQNNSSGLEMKRHVGHRTSETADEQSMSKTFGSGSMKEGELHGSCKCGSFSFYITRPEPYHGDGPQHQWWLADPEDPNCTKYKAELDACTTCRLVTGFEITAWTHVPFINVYIKADNDTAHALTAETKFPQLTQYQSSKGIWRAFCTTCGAPVFYRKQATDPLIIDICGGLYQDPMAGARCEGWFEWASMAFSEDSIDRAFISEIEQNLSAYKKRSSS